MLAKLRELCRSGAAFSFLVAIFGTFVAIFSITRLGFGSRFEVGSGTFPSVIGILLAGAGFISGVSSVRHQSSVKDLESQLSRKSFLRIVYMVIGFVVWLLLTPFLGYVPTTFVVSIAMAKAVGLERWFRPIVLSLGIAVSIYLLFDLMFYVDLPRGILG